MKPNSKILITRKLKENSILKAWVEDSASQLIEQSFIQFKSISNLEIPKTDWIFFSSPNGLNIYLKEYKIRANKIAVFGSGSNDRLVHYQLKAAFIGDSSKDSSEIGKDFFELIKDESVLFPIGQISTHHIASQGKKEQMHELIIYETLLKTLKVSEEFDYIIFTSPSNVDAYLLENKISSNVKIIAFGKTTAKRLEKHIDKNRINKPNSPKEKDLIALLKSLE